MGACDTNMYDRKPGGRRISVDPAVWSLRGSAACESGNSWVRRVIPEP